MHLAFKYYEHLYPEFTYFVFRCKFLDTHLFSAFNHLVAALKQPNQEKSLARPHLLTKHQPGMNPTLPAVPFGAIIFFTLNFKKAAPHQKSKT